MYNIASKIHLPPVWSALLGKDRVLSGALLTSLPTFETWFADNKLIFFPGYTDHGPDHIVQVLEAAAELTPKRTRAALTPADAFVLVLAVLLHDSAMHLSEDGLLRIVRSNPHAVAPREYPQDRPWHVLWAEFVFEAKRWGPERRRETFGDETPVRDPGFDSMEWTVRDRLLIGEFIRRHHTRMAFEFAVAGVPGTDTLPFQVEGVAKPLLRLAGIIARSHGESIRQAVDRLSPEGRRTQSGVHVPFLMALLRIADYVQIHASRAPRDLLRFRSLRSPFSQREWLAHDSITDIRPADRDPEALWIDAQPQTAAMFFKIDALFRDIQSELDQCWNAIGEVYGYSPEKATFGLTIRRLRSTLDDKRFFGLSVPYLPQKFVFEAASADLLPTLVGPLYNHDPSIALRELLQNALDAVRELRSIRLRSHPATPPDSLSNEEAVVVRLKVASDGTWLEVEDFGVGMTAATVATYFLRVGASFRNSAEWRTLHLNDQGRSATLRTGKFGVGAMAAFLAGDLLHVCTRHYTSSDAIEFTTCLVSGQDLIEVHKTTRDSCGTTVGIRLTVAEPERALPDWFQRWCYLAEPTVRTEGFELPARAMPCVPSVRQQLSDPWNRLDVPNFDDVVWGYSRRGTGWTTLRQEALFCNGFLITEWSRSSRPLFRENGFDIPMPSVSVFDSDGLVPLNLQRTELGLQGLPFIRSLERAVADQIVSSVVLLSERKMDSILTWSPLGLPSRIGDSLLGEGFFALAFCARGVFLFHPSISHDVVDDKVLVIYEDDWHTFLERRVDLATLPPVVVFSSSMDEEGFGWAYHVLRRNMPFDDVGVHPRWFLGVEALVSGRRPKERGLSRWGKLLAKVGGGLHHRYVGKIPDPQGSVLLRGALAGIRCGIWHLRRPERRCLTSREDSALIEAWKRHVPTTVLPWT